jgi:hypothetical protein
MLEINAQEVKNTGPGHPRNFGMFAALSFVSWTGRSFIFSLYLPYLTSIFDMLRRVIGVPAGISIAPFSSVLRFVNRQTAMPVTCLRAAVQP